MKTFARMSLLTLGLAAALVQAQDAPPPAAVDIEVATREEFAPVLWTPASVVSRHDARVAAEQSGQVTFVAEIGDRIQQGGVLARIDDRMHRLAVDEARATHSRIAAQLEFARSQEQRMQQLAQQATVSRVQSDQTAAERRVLQEQLKGAEVALRQEELRLQQATLRAPFSGTVVERLIAVGEYLSPGAAVVRLVDTEHLEVQARAPVGLAGFVRAGEPLQVKQGGQQQAQRVRAVVPVGDAVSRQFEVRLSVDAPRWPIGAALEVGLPAESAREVLSVPRDALVLRPGERYVMRVGEGDIAERVVVTTGATQDDRIEVSGDVQAGDRLVVRGAERLQPGQKVRIDSAQLSQLADSTLPAGSR